MSVLSHITLGTNDTARSVRFYDAVLGTLGWERLPRPPEKAPVYAKGGVNPMLYLYRPDDGRPATWGNGTHIAFEADSHAAVDAFHTLALENGGMSEGAAGPRPQYGPGYYAAYVRDPDGNKLQAVCHGEG